MGQKDLVNLDLLAELQLKAAELTPDMILSCAEQAADAAVKIQRNLNRRMVLEQLLFGAVGNH
jgi:hypothetical protein